MSLLLKNTFNYLSALNDHIWEHIKFDKIFVWVWLGLFIAVVAFAFYLRFSSNKLKFNTRELAFAAITIAMSYALSFIKIYSNPNGGSITAASAVPLAIFCYMAGFRKGLLAGFAYSVLQILQTPKIYNPIQMILDYTLAFSAIAVVALFNKQKYGIIYGLILYGIIRYICSTLSGVIFFASYAPVGQSAIIYSMGYNAVILIDAAISAIAGYLLVTSKAFMRTLNQFILKAADRSTGKHSGETTVRLADEQPSGSSVRPVDADSTDITVRLAETEKQSKE